MVGQPGRFPPPSFAALPAGRVIPLRLSLPLPFATPGLADGHRLLAPRKSTRPKGAKTMSKTSKTTSTKTEAPRADVYTRVTDRIVSDLEKGVRTWLKPWSAEHATDRLPLRISAHRGRHFRLIVDGLSA